MSEPKKVDRRKFIYAGLGAVALIAIGAAAYVAMNPPVVTQTTTVPTTSVVTTTVPTTSVVTTTSVATTTVPTTSVVTTTTTKYVGVVLKVPQMAGWASQAPGIALVNEFENSTGIKVVYDMIPPADVASKEWLEVSNRTGNYDIVTVGADRVHPRFLPYCIGLNKYIEATWGSIKNFEDKVFLTPQRSAVYQGEYRGIPIHANVMFGVYRKSLFEDPKNQKAFESTYGYELRQPRTLQEVEDIASFFTKPPMYGLTANLIGAPAPAGFSLFLHCFMSAGFDVLDKNFRPTMKYDDKAYEVAVEIARWWQDGIYKKKFINPDAAKFKAADMFDFYMSGMAAMGFGWFGDIFGIKLQTKDVIDKIGESVDFVWPSFRPQSESGGFASYWIHGILDTCKNPDAAWEYIKWVASERYQLACAAVQVPPFKDLAEKANHMPNPNNPNIPLLPNALYQSFLKGARIWFYIRELDQNVPELCYEPWDTALQLWGSLMANQITPEKLVEEWAKAIETKLEASGYYKK
jgi:multiple sugar transport system substrate-binding protein